MLDATAPRRGLMVALGVALCLYTLAEVNYPLLVGLGRDDVQEAFGPVWGIPVTFYIDREGTMCKKHMGLATKEQVERDIRSLL